VKRIAVLGSTGSIGRQTLEIAAQHPDRLKVVALAANRSADAVQKQARALGISNVALMDEAEATKAGLKGGMSAIVDLCTDPNVDIVVVAVAGVIGLLPTLAAIKAGKMIALASKEVLVAAGEVVMPLIREQGVTLTPIDSEHSALFQCLQGYSSEQIDSLILTASGGPFRGRKRSELESVTVEQTLAHPTWNMGGKITVDSATLMNKGLEMIEARWLFDVPVERVEAVVHPQSIVHSFVKFKDGSVLGQLGWPNMRLPIQYALLYPERKPNELPAWNPVDTPNLTFEPMELETFRCPALARESVKVGGTMPCAMNAANEEAANAFIAGNCTFLGIADVVEGVMFKHEPDEPTLESLLATDLWARETARHLMQL